MNGVGADACILIYDARAGKVVSLNAEGTAPKLATIEWYKKNADGKIPANDTLLSASLPCVVDAWYMMLDRWGTMTLGELLQPAIELSDNGFPISDALAGYINHTEKIRTVTAGFNSSNSGNDMVITGGYIGNQRPEEVEGSIIGKLLDHLDIIPDLVERNVSRSLNHSLDSGT
jgi:hypothetical protein